MMAEKKFLTVRDVAEILQVVTKTVERWIDKGELIAHRFNGRIRISQADFEAFVRARRAPIK
jgi:excisionase family DNA binding protein